MKKDSDEYRETMKAMGPPPLNVEHIFPADDFFVVLDNAKTIDIGIVIGYSEDGQLLVYGGGLLDGKRPTAKDWLWMVETFKQKLIAGDYAET